ncbi:adenylate kinase [Galbitalea sp. SE-J8]|uniref:adenylate kinase n=1 Tax=Galbitalea sp. SE-J8 TaxID=3054952 RepID=UPI00259C87A5|nr:adenylate kinase [Galbitalea sp. SE-J8]MDM4761473.1 adenylate kinase [Galbitalea sp. SE-J8]
MTLAQRGARLLIVGPPGSGKGTQSVRISEHYGVPAIATGDIFRENVRNETELGLKVKAIMDAGDFVPNELTNELVADRLAQPDVEHGFLLDGYPRTIGQLEFLDERLAVDGFGLDAVIELVVDEDEVVQRLLRRAHEQGRTDDTEDTIRHRQQLYAKETAPLIATYAKRGIVARVDAFGSVAAVSERIAEALEARGVAA